MNSKEWLGIGIFLIAVILVSAILVTPGAGLKGENGSTITITDQAGRDVKIPKKVDSVVATGPGALRFIAYLNATEKVSGVERVEKTWAKDLPYNVANPELRSLPTIGPPFGGNPELIAEQNPDVIFWRFASAGQAKDLQDKTGIPVIVLGTGGPSGPWKDGTFYESLRIIGKALGKEERAEKVIQFMENTIQELNYRTDNIPETEKSDAFICSVSWGKSSQGITSTMSDFPPFRFVNAKNVAEDLDKRHAMISEETILNWNPEIIFIDQGGYSSALESLQSPKYTSLNAVKTGDIYRIWPYHFYEINFGMVLSNSYYIGKLLYPNRFEDLNLEKKANEIFGELVGENVYENLIQSFGKLTKVELEE